MNTQPNGKGNGPKPVSRRPSEEAARAAIEAWLEVHAPGYPTYSLVEDGDEDSAEMKCGWAFWIVDADTTSYVHEDLTIEWYGTMWPELYQYDGDTGNWIAVDTQSPETLPQPIRFEDWVAGVEREVGAHVERESYRRYYDQGLSPANAVLQDRLEAGVLERSSAEAALQCINP
ncbi:hypothetical protein ACXIVK_00015 [Paraburkholderia caledonica]|jgi:hypothetical protein